jgi:hypothetical protein
MGRGTGLWYVLRYLRETFILRVENKPVNRVGVDEPGSKVEDGEPVCDYALSLEN